MLLKMKSGLLLSCALLIGCASSTTPAKPKTSAQTFSVQAALETPVTDSIGDSADDPAIYIGENGDGFILGTDKQAGLYVYNLDGTLRKFMRLGTLNNVDVRDGFSYRGRDHVLIVASNDDLNNITVLLFDPATDTFVTPDGSLLPTGDFSPYGICLTRTVNGTFHAGVTSKAGIYQQYAISAKDGRMQAVKVRDFSTGGKTEGCVFDDRTGQLYIAEEEGGLYRYPAMPSGKDTQIVIAKHTDHGMAADLEGVSIYEQGPNGGYLIVSSQGNHSYAVFALPSHEFVGRFRIVDGDLDATSTTDGIAATSLRTARFPEGFLVVQDDSDDTSPSEANKRQNFKIIDWREIKPALQ